jgi:energy-coupling factor transporter ATP-binding protein EcfA2
MKSPTSIEEVNERINALIIHHQTFSTALKRIEYCHRVSLTKREPRSLMIVGVSGSGKSLLQQHYVSKFPRETNETSTRIPVIAVRIPAPPVLSAVADEILAAFGDLYRGGTIKAQKDRIIMLLKQCQVELVLLDEYQLLYDNGRAKTYLKVTDWLKDIFDNAGIPMVALGLVRSGELMEFNDQFRRRFSALHLLGKWTLTDNANRLDFLAFISTLEKTLGFSEKSDLSELEMAGRIFYATDGIPGYVLPLVVSAAYYAAEEKANSINMTHLRKAFLQEIYGSAANENNPFDDAFVARRLDRNGEPFAPVRS